MTTPGEGVQFSDLQLVCRGQHSEEIALPVLEDDRFCYALARDMSGFRRVQAVPGVAMRDDVIQGIPWSAKYLSIVAAMAISVLPSFLPP